MKALGPKMIKKNYTFVLNFGYVESSGLSYLPFSSRGKYATAREALVDLSNFMKEEYLRDNMKPLKKCCTANKKKNPSMEFCPKCGSPLKEEEFDVESFIEWVANLNGSIIDGFQIDMYSGDKRWESLGLEGTPNQRFVYQAEWVIAAAIGYPIRADITFDDICKSRTKQKKQSFTYY